MNTSPDAPWKDGRERSERWKETLKKDFLPRMSDGTGSPGPGGCGRPRRRPNGDVILIITLILVNQKMGADRDCSCGLRFCFVFYQEAKR